MSIHECKHQATFTEKVVTRITPSMLDDIVDFAWYRRLDAEEAIRLLLQQGILAQDRIKTPHGDRRRSADEVVVDSRLE